VPLQTATKGDLVAKYNQLARSITSINAGVTMHLTAGSAYSGVIKAYPQVSGFILAQKPAMVRVIGQVPVIGTTAFDMVSDGKTFSIYVPSKSQFLTGPATLEKPSEKPVENLRPQHLMEAIFWQPIPEADPVLFEQAMDDTASDYVLTAVTRGPGGATDWKIARKIWFERVGLTMARIETYADDGQLESDIQYSEWAPFGSVEYPKQITLARPADGYTLAITVTKLTSNETIEASRFVLQQPAGAQLVHVGEDTGGGQN
jgi:outer membrane lipoprotein-sorting protein